MRRCLVRCDQLGGLDYHGCGYIKPQQVWNIDLVLLLKTARRIERFLYNFIVEDGYYLFQRGGGYDYLLWWRSRAFTSLLRSTLPGDW